MLNIIKSATTKITKQQFCRIPIKFFIKDNDDNTLPVVGKTGSVMALVLR